METPNFSHVVNEKANWSTISEKVDGSFMDERMTLEVGVIYQIVDTITKTMGTTAYEAMVLKDKDGNEKHMSPRAFNKIVYDKNMVDGYHPILDNKYVVNGKEEPTPPKVLMGAFMMITEQIEGQCTIFDSTTNSSKLAPANQAQVIIPKSNKSKRLDCKDGMKNHFEFRVD